MQFKHKGVIQIYKFGSLITINRNEINQLNHSKTNWLKVTEQIYEAYHLCNLNIKGVIQIYKFGSLITINQNEINRIDI
jgi:diphthamide biosynthesis methyltransferase